MDNDDTASKPTGPARRGRPPKGERKGPADPPEATEPAPGPVALAEEEGIDPAEATSVPSDPVTPEAPAPAPAPVLATVPMVAESGLSALARLDLAALKEMGIRELAQVAK